MKNKHRSLVAMFFEESCWFEQSWLRVIKGTFLPSYIEMGPVVSDKKFFFFWLPCQPESFMDSTSLKNFQSVSPFGSGALKRPKIDGIFKFISREIFMLSYVKQETICL